MLDRLALYDTLFALAASDGREEALFGTCAPLARKAFSKSLAGEEMPLVWFEVPLGGEPRFDLHVAFSREALHAGTRFLPEAGSGYDELLRWYADEERGGGGLAFAYDVSEGRIDMPAVHVNTNDAPLDDAGAFFDIAAGEGAAELFCDFVGRLPPGWRVWYAGVHPGRPGSPIRIDCFVERALQNAYASQLDLLEHDLAACGFAATDTALRSLATTILESPFALELQFDVMRDGRLGPTLGLSAGLSPKTATSTRQLFENSGPAAQLLGKAERLGLADERWRLVPDASFTRLVKVDAGATVFHCVPTFVKLRMRDGAPLDAKVYLQAGCAAIAG